MIQAARKQKIKDQEPQHADGMRNAAIYSLKRMGNLTILQSADYSRHRSHTWCIHSSLFLEGFTSTKQRGSRASACLLWAEIASSPPSFTLDEPSPISSSSLVLLPGPSLFDIAYHALHRSTDNWKTEGRAVAVTAGRWSDATPFRVRLTILLSQRRRHNGFILMGR